MKTYRIQSYSKLLKKYLNKKPYTTTAKNKTDALYNYYDYIEKRYQTNIYDIKDAANYEKITYIIKCKQEHPTK